jgi:uncharacterized membrane protein YeaQ/YmgE (transglycosylase-associated protein family)
LKIFEIVSLARILPQNPQIYKFAYRNICTVEIDMILICFIEWCVIGAIVGTLAGTHASDRGFDLLIDITIGISGSIIGVYLTLKIGIPVENIILASILPATSGAVIASIMLKLARRYL